MPPNLVLVNLELNDGAIDSNIFEEALAAWNAELAVNHIQLLQTNFSLETNTEFLDPCVTQVVVADVQDCQISVLKYIVQIHSSMVTELYVVTL